MSTTYFVLRLTTTQGIGTLGKLPGEYDVLFYLVKELDVSLRFMQSTPHLFPFCEAKIENWDEWMKTFNIAWRKIKEQFLCSYEVKPVICNQYGVVSL